MNKRMKNDAAITDKKNGKQLFELLGDLDENMVEDAWLDHGEEVIIMEERSPFRFVKIAAGIAAAIAIVGGGIYGFNKYKNSIGFSPAAGFSDESDISDNEFSEVESSEPEASDISEPEVIDHIYNLPADEPTIFMGFGNDKIMNSDVTRTNTDKKPSEIMPEDWGASVYCDGFAYFKEPMGVAYDSYHNPEMFTYTGNPDKKDGNSFYAEMPQNTNKWQRLYVGEEMCGLRLAKATTQFKINEPGDGGKIEILTDDENLVEFEGRIEIEGILCVDAPNLSNDGGGYKFYPTEDKLPILGGSRKTIMDYHVCYAHETCAVHVVNEYPYVKIEKAFADSSEIEGIGLGDAVLARVTLSDIRYPSASSVHASIDAVEILSEPIAHVDEWMQK